MKQIALLAGILALAGCGGDGDESAATDEGGGESKTIELTATDFRFDPDTIRLDAAGTYTFLLRNDGQTEHALEIEGAGIEEETDVIGPGETAEVTVELAEGEYELYCPVGDHRGRGMEGDLIVGSGKAGNETGETDDGY